MRRLLQPMLLSALAAVGACGGISQEEIHAALAAELADSTPPEYVEASFWKVSREIYADAGGDPLWVDGDAPRKRARALVEAVASAEDQGLRTAEYDLDGLGGALQRAYKDGETTPAELAELDLRLTALYVDYGRHLLSGRLDPSRVNQDWFIRTRRATVDSTLRQAATAEDLEKALADFLPRQPDYRTLLAARARYAAIAAQGGFPEVPAPVAEGDTGAAVAALVQRLVLEGDLDSSAVSLTTYDGQVSSGVERFRRRFGLEAGKGVDKAVIAAMKVPVDRRIRQIELNLERLRWLPNEFGTRYVAVNIPDFQLYAYDEGREVMTMRVIVGDEYDGTTPVFADTMNQVVFRPYWNVPSSIAVDEILPLVQKSESYLARNEYEVLPVKGSEPVDPGSVDWNDLDSTNFPYMIRQKPGPRNALGLVKFLFPNRFDIYMHDTPGDHLFQRSRRALSHGCIRLEHPAKFAEYVLEGMDEWTPDRIESAMNAEEQRQVMLKRPIPVYILYLTAFAREGEVHFRPDLYDADTRGMERLGKAPPAEQIAALRATFDELMKG